MEGTFHSVFCKTEHCLDSNLDEDEPEKMDSEHLGVTGFGTLVELKNCESKTEKPERNSKTWDDGHRKDIWNWALGDELDTGNENERA